jgi:hypothetical protein
MRIVGISGGSIGGRPRRNVDVRDKVIGEITNICCLSDFLLIGILFIEFLEGKRWEVGGDV